MIIMFSKIFKSSVELYNIAFAFGMYPDLCIPLVERMVDFKLFEEEMEEIRLSSL